MCYALAENVSMIRLGFQIRRVKTHQRQHLQIISLGSRTAVKDAICSRLLPFRCHPGQLVCDSQAMSPTDGKQHTEHSWQPSWRVRQLRSLQRAYAAYYYFVDEPTADYYRPAVVITHALCIAVFIVL